MPTEEMMEGTQAPQPEVQPPQPCCEQCTRTMGEVHNIKVALGEIADEFPEGSRLREILEMVRCVGPEGTCQYTPTPATEQAE